MVNVIFLLKQFFDILIMNVIRCVVVIRVFLYYCPSTTKAKKNY